MIRFITSLVQLILFIPAAFGLRIIYLQLKHDHKTKTGFFQ